MPAPEDLPSAHVRTSRQISRTPRRIPWRAISVMALIVGVCTCFTLWARACMAEDRRYQERDARLCAAFSMELPRVERIVRGDNTLRVYAREQSSDMLAEYIFPPVSLRRFVIPIVAFFSDVSEGHPIWVVSTAQMRGGQNGGRFCEQRLEVHVRSARDIE